jgi:hypothetical protein
MNTKLSGLLVAALIVAIPASSQAVTKCKVKVDRKTGVIKVDARDVVGSMLWGGAAGEEASAFFNESSCVVGTKARRCTLAAEGTVEAITPPSTCFIHLADDGAESCSAFISGCTPGIRDAAYCWDLNADGECDVAIEDINADGGCDVLDCVGAQGPQGIQGPQGPPGNTGSVASVCEALGADANCDLAGVISYCVPNPCLNGGTCILANASYTCNCVAGWDGPSCQYDRTLVSGTGACTGVDDITAISGQQINWLTTYSSFEVCATQPPWDCQNASFPDQEQCLADCMGSVIGTSGPCGLCFGTRASCVGLQVCYNICNSYGSSSPACINCMLGNVPTCDPAFETCSGLNPAYFQMPIE